MYFRVRLFIMLEVGKLVFSRDLQGRNHGRLMNRRKDIEIHKICEKLTMNKKEGSDLFVHFWFNFQINLHTNGNFPFVFFVSNQKCL